MTIKKVIHLDLSGNNINSEVLNKIKKANKLQSLNLSSNKLGDTELETIIEIIQKNNRHLTKIDLSNTNLTEQHLVKISNALKNNQHIVSLKCSSITNQNSNILKKINKILNQRDTKTGKNNSSNTTPSVDTQIDEFMITRPRGGVALRRETVTRIVSRSENSQDQLATLKKKIADLDAILNQFVKNASTQNKLPSKIKKSKALKIHYKTLCNALEQLLIAAKTASSDVFALNIGSLTQDVAQTFLELVPGGSFVNHAVTEITSRTQEALLKQRLIPIMNAINNLVDFPNYQNSQQVLSDIAARMTIFKEAEIENTFATANTGKKIIAQSDRNKNKEQAVCKLAEADISNIFTKFQKQEITIDEHDADASIRSTVGAFMKSAGYKTTAVNNRPNYNSDTKSRTLPLNLNSFATQSTLKEMQLNFQRELNAFKKEMKEDNSHSKQEREKLQKELQEAKQEIETLKKKSRKNKRALITVDQEIISKPKKRSRKRKKPTSKTAWGNDNPQNTKANNVRTPAPLTRKANATDLVSTSL